MKSTKLQIAETETRKMFKNFCSQNNLEINEREFQEFLYYLDIDFRQ
jgi:hypothetical protein